MSEPTNAIQRQETRLPIQASQRGLLLTSFDDYWRFATCVVRGGLAPKGDTPEAVLLKLQRGAELGLSYMTSIENIMVVNNRTAVWGDAMLAMCRESEHWDEAAFAETYEGTAYQDTFSAVVTVGRKGAKPITERFSVADAKEAGLWGKSGPWTQYKKRMLKYRARGFALRDAFADVLKGMRSYEEERDVQFVESRVVGVESRAADRLADLGAKYAKTPDQPGPATDEPTHPQDAPSAESAPAGPPVAGMARVKYINAGRGEPMPIGDDDQPEPVDSPPNGADAPSMAPEPQAGLLQGHIGTPDGIYATWSDLNPDVPANKARGAFAAWVKDKTGKHPDKCGPAEWAKVEEALR